MVHSQKAPFPSLTLCSHSLPCPWHSPSPVCLYAFEDSGDSLVGVPQEVSFCDIHPGGGRYQPDLPPAEAEWYFCPPLL